jgi:hypothetical protein
MKMNKEISDPPGLKANIPAMDAPPSYIIFAGLL